MMWQVIANSNQDLPHLVSENLIKIDVDLKHISNHHEFKNFYIQQKNRVLSNIQTSVTVARFMSCGILW